MSVEGRYPLIDLAARVGFTRHVGGLVTTTLLTERCGLRPGLRVLEVGCGAGRTAAHIAEHLGCDVVACDAHPGMLGWARQQAERQGVADAVDVVFGDVRDLPWPDDTFDAVISESVLVLVGDKAAAVAEMARVTRPGGVVGLNEGTLVGGEAPDAVASYAGDVLGGVAFERAGVWTDLLRSAGLERVSGEQRPFRAADELRTITRWIGVGEYLRFTSRILRLYRNEPDLRELVRTSLQTPRDVTKHMGAGIYVGEVPVG